MADEKYIVYGACEKHPNFSMLNCHVCILESKQDSLILIDEEIKKVDEKILAGEIVLEQCREQMRNLKDHRNNIIALKNKTIHS